MVKKIIGNRYIYLAFGTTLQREQTLGAGFGRCRTNDIDYLMFSIVLFIAFCNLKIRLPKFMQRKF